MHNHFTRLLLASIISVSIFTNIEAVFHTDESGKLANEKNASNLINNAKFSKLNPSSLEQLFYVMATGSTGIEKLGKRHKTHYFTTKENREKFAAWNPENPLDKNLGFRTAAKDGSDNNTLIMMSKYAAAYGAKLRNYFDNHIAYKLQTTDDLLKIFNFEDTSWDLHQTEGLESNISRHRGYLMIFVALGADLELADVTIRGQKVTVDNAKKMLKSLIKTYENPLEIIKIDGGLLYNQIKELEYSSDSDRKIIKAKELFGRNNIESMQKYLDYLAEKSKHSNISLKQTTNSAINHVKKQSIKPAFTLKKAEKEAEGKVIFDEESYNKALEELISFGQVFYSKNISSEKPNQPTESAHSKSKTPVEKKLQREIKSAVDKVVKDKTVNKAVSHLQKVAQTPKDAKKVASKAGDLGKKVASEVNTLTKSSSFKKKKRRVRRGLKNKLNF